MNAPAVDTIAAIATAAGAGGIGVVRLSGPASLDIARRISGRRPRPRHAHYARFRDDAGEALDEGVLLYFPGPASFTGEDVVELQGHGGQVVLQRLLARTVELGARRARAGEFSERAFLNGKLDLAQAEAIADLIAAHSEQAARAAMRSLQGAFSQRVLALVEQVTVLRVHVEAAIDFPDEDIDFLADRLIQQRLDAARNALAELLVEAQRGVRIRDGLHAVIVGPPNAGKSSLLNALAGSERAIVTDRAGTTRDVLRETIRIDDFELVLADTAGLRGDSDDPIEREGMRRAREEQSRADLLLAMVECGDATGEQGLRDEFDGHPGLVWLHSKCDLHGEAPRREVRAAHDHLWISTRDAEGVAPLRRWLSERAGGIDPSHVGFSARQRHVEALQLAAQHMDTAALQLQQRSGELMAEELRLVQQALGEITGVVDADALLGRIFSSFCIGK